MQEAIAINMVWKVGRGIDNKSARMLTINRNVMAIWASQVALVVKNPPANAGDAKDTGLIPGSGRSFGGGYGNPLQYSCLENPMDRRAQ